ncbi:MAG: hypothetical protein AAGJ80_00995, partial [Cyanobacteria bacterium J06553_1]
MSQYGGSSGNYYVPSSHTSREKVAKEENVALYIVSREKSGEPLFSTIARKQGRNEKGSLTFGEPEDVEITEVFMNGVIPRVGETITICHDTFKAKTELRYTSPETTTSFKVVSVIHVAGLSAYFTYEEDSSKVF